MLVEHLLILLDIKKIAANFLRDQSGPGTVHVSDTSLAPLA